MKRFITILFLSLCFVSCDDAPAPPPPPPIVVKAADYSPIRDAVKFIGLCLLGAAVVKTIGTIISSNDENKH